MLIFSAELPLQRKQGKFHAYQAIYVFPVGFFLLKIYTAKQTTMYC